ncbi:MAG: SGNH/GDSL hydrolase family protein [Clostridia bacterium]|nr:SGNH/GDSL hydrolase family protein [Clostridia bacterium]
MELNGIKANFLGDSITEGVGTSSPDKTFHQLIAKKYCLAASRNYGISATRLAKQYKPSDNPRADLDFCSRVGEMDGDADLIVVFGGTNDYGHGDAPFGEFGDRTPDTFCGACHTLMSSLITKYPDAVIVIMTPLHRASEDVPSVGNHLPLLEYVNMIRRVAEFYSLPVMDLWSVSGIQPRVKAIRENFCPDGLHPNDAGHERMAERIANFLLTL